MASVRYCLLYLDHDFRCYISFSIVPTCSEFCDGRDLSLPHILRWTHVVQCLGNARGQFHYGPMLQLALTYTASVNGELSEEAPHCRTMGHRTHPMRASCITSRTNNPHGISLNEDSADTRLVLNLRLLRPPTGKCKSTGIYFMPFVRNARNQFMGSVRQEGTMISKLKVQHP